MNSEFSILIVDDEEHVRESIRFVLKDRYRTVTKADAKDALDYMAGNPVDLVILDFNMPEMDGLTALETIRKKFPETVVLMLTAHSPPEKIRRAFRLGAVGLLMKPFDMKDLARAVAEAVASRSVTGSVSAAEKRRD